MERAFEEYSHLLSLRVMRLYNSVSKNTTGPIVANMTGKEFFYYFHFQFQFKRRSITQETPNRLFEPLMRAIRLPDSFGSIYTSQIFSSYIVVSNISEDLVDAENPRCKVKLAIPNGNEIELGNSADTYSERFPMDSIRVQSIWHLNNCLVRK